MKYVLMNQKYKVADVELNDKTSKILKINDVYDLKRMPFSFQNAYYDKSKSNVKTLQMWFKGRGIPSWRKDLKRLLGNLGVESTDELLNKAYGLSLSDQYWLCPQRLNIKWENINFFTNDFQYKGYLTVALSFSNSIPPSLASPNNTTDGMLPKAWIIEDGNRILVKNTYTPSMQEPINEWLASQICERMGFEYVPYSVSVYNYRIVSKCVDFIHENEELVSVYDIFYSEKKSNSDSDLQHYVKVLEKHEICDAKEKLEDMIFLDYLIMNTDRHMKNFGII